MRLDDRPGAPTHVGSPREQLHTHVLRIPQYLNWQPKTEKEAIAIVLKAIVVCRMVPHLKQADHAVLDVMLAHVNGRHFQQTGELFCWPGEVALLDATNLSPTGMYRAIRRLAALGLVAKGTADISGQTIDGYFLNTPELPLDWSRGRKSVRQARGIVGKYARAPRGARSEGVARAPAGTSAQPVGRAHGPTSLHNNTRARLEAVQSEAVPTQTISSSSSPGPVPEPQPVGGAAAAELRELGAEETDIREVIQLPIATRDNVLAWCEMARASKRIENPPRFVVAMLRNGKLPADKWLRQAKAKLRRQEITLGAGAQGHTVPQEAIERGKRFRADAEEFIRKHQTRRAGAPGQSQ